MTDYFQLLGQQRAPWLNPAEIEQAFLAATSEAHPDRVHEAPPSERRKAHDQTAEINRAHVCLRNPRTCLRHFLELERRTGISDLQEIPEDLLQTFMDVGRLLSSADTQAQKLSETTSPLLKVAEFVNAQQLQDALQACEQRLSQRRESLEAQVQTHSQRWAGLTPEHSTERGRLLAELEAVYRLMTFHDRWIEQVQARRLKLMGLA